MAETRLLDRLTASDLFLLLWDDYGWSTDIGALAILDGTTLLDRDGRVRIAEHDKVVTRVRGDSTVECGTTPWWHPVTFRSGA